MNQFNHQFCVLTYNRPVLLKKNIDSILNQTQKNVRIKVSDCSTNDETYKIIHKNYSNYIINKILEYKRIPQIKEFDHHKKVLEECNYDFMTLLHDDDTIYPEYIENIFKIFSLRPDLSAVAVNGDCELENHINNKKIFYMRKSFKDEILCDLNKFYQNYFGYQSLGVCHHSGYTFNIKKIRKTITGIDFSSNKETLDVFYLGNILNEGPIYYIGKPLMTVKWHKESANANQSISDRFFLIGKIKSLIRKNKLKKNNLDDYRFCIYFNWEKKKFKKKNLLKFKLFYYFINLTSLTTYYLLLKKKFFQIKHENK